MALVDQPLRAFGVLDSRWAAGYLDAAETSATEADPRPGTASTTATLPRLDPAITGAQEVDVTIAVLQAGYPTPGGGGLGTGYYLSGQTISSARGFQAPTFVADYRYPGAGGAGEYHSDAAFCDLNGYVVTRHGNTAASGPVHRYNPHTNAITAITSTALGDTSAIAYKPGTERLYVVGSTAVRWSDDHAATWTPIDTSSRVLAACTGSPTFSAPDALAKYRAAWDDLGGLLWVGIDTSGGTSKLQAVASDDDGATWVSAGTIATTRGVDAARHPDGWIALVTWEDDGANYSLRFRRLNSAFDDPSDLDYVEIANIANISGISVGCDSNGAIWVFYSGNTVGGITASKYSTDDGVTWTAAADVSNQPDCAVRLCPSPMGGLIGCGSANNTALNGWMQFGGWSGPGRDGNDWCSTTGSRADLCWIASALPDVALFGMTANGTGTYVAFGSSGTAPVGYMQISQSGGVNSRNFDLQIHAGDRTEAACEFIALVPDDNGTTAAAIASKIGVRLRTKSAAANQQRTLILYLDEAGYRVWDDEASAWRISKVALDLTTRAHFRFSFSGSDGEVAHRRDGETLWTRTTWATIGTSATAGSQAHVTFGHLADAGATVSRWWYMRARGVEAPALVGTDNIGIGATRYPIPDAHDTSRERLAWMRIRGGPAVPGEAYTIPVSYGYPVESVFPTSEPSPARRWRSSASGVDQRITCDFAFDTDLGGCASVALALRGCNFRRAKLQGKPDGGAWTTLGTLDLATGFDAISFDRIGDRLVPSGVSTGSRYVRKNELRGGHVVMDPTGTAVLRTIRGNAAGWWDASAGSRVAVYLDDCDDTEPLSGDLYLVWPDGVLVVHQAQDGTTYRHWAVKVEGTELTQEAYYEIGNAYLFGVEAPGKQWSDGYEWSHTPNVRIDTDPYGTDRRQQLGPTRRSLSLTWDDGAKEDRLQSADEWIAAPGGGSVVARDDVRGQLIGLLDAAKGGALPVLVLLADPSAASYTVTDPVQWLVGYVQGDVRFQQGRNGPELGEFMRGGPIQIVEAV